MIKHLLEKDFVSAYSISSRSVEPDTQIVGAGQFDLDDSGVSPFPILPVGQGKASFDNTHGELEVINYEGFINQCKRPASFLQGRKKCDYLMAHEDVEGAVLLLEITSATGNCQNLSKPILYKDHDKGFQYPGGKNEKCEVQLSHSLRDLMSVTSIKDKLLSYRRRVCLMAYRVNLNAESQQLRSFQRYLRVESRETGSEGALLSSNSINVFDFEYRRISHDVVFVL